MKNYLGQSGTMQLVQGMRMALTCHMRDYGSMKWENPLFQRAKMKNFPISKATGLFYLLYLHINKVIF